MDTNSKSLFQLMRFNILNSAKMNWENTPFSPAYIYAWDSGVYPAFNDGADWHKSFVDQFEVSEKEVVELGKFLDKKWLAKSAISFYELEDHYEVSHSTETGWDRGKLLISCRYMYLNRMFDNSFWSALIENGKCPTEAFSICQKLEKSDIYFV
ncbi:MAG: hypothetical protein WDA22_17375 [Bacteroidota bacterium]